MTVKDPVWLLKIAMIQLVAQMSKYYDCILKFVFLNYVTKLQSAQYYSCWKWSWKWNYWTFTGKLHWRKDQGEKTNVCEAWMPFVGLLLWSWYLSIMVAVAIPFLPSKYILYSILIQKRHFFHYFSLDSEEAQIYFDFFDLHFT